MKTNDILLPDEALRALARMLLEMAADSDDDLEDSFPSGGPSVQ